MWLYAAQFAFPLILIGWLVRGPERSALGFVVQVFGSFTALIAMTTWPATMSHCAVPGRK